MRGFRPPKTLARQIKERLALGQRYENNDLVCSRMHGTPLDPAKVSVSFARLTRSLDLPCVRLHDLRHDHATHLLRLGVHAKSVSERLGHSGVAITLDTYSHVLPSMQQDAAQRLDEDLEGDVGAVGGEGKESNLPSPLRTTTRFEARLLSYWPVLLSP